VYNNVIVGVAGASGTAISFTPSSGAIHAQAVANTITRSRVGIGVLQWNDGADTARVDGTISSNLIRATTGIYATAAISPSLTNDYNLVNAESNGVTFGAHTITADAKIVSESTPRLRSDSPAIGAADSATVLLGILFNGLPDLDADGLRRLKGTPNAVDIGAYEFGDLTFSHTVTTGNTGSGSYITRFDDASTDGVPGAKVMVTSNFNDGTPPGVLYAPPFGVYYDLGKWQLFAQDIAPAPLGAHFDVFVPAIGGGSFTQVATGDNISGAASRIDNSSTDSLPDRIVLATQNWTVGNHGIYNPHQVGLLYFGKWFVANLDGAPMPVNAGFNVYAQAASPNAFRVVASMNGSALVLDHSLLNGIPCARPHVSRILGASSTDYGFDVDYFAGHWEIYGHAPLAVGDSFNVVIDPAQVAACTDRIFANDFE
ncbi:MAG: choice-of-anchor Q domain-containing protein, partial [Dokdonella sp.]|uniref:DUF7452 domain-containing protein n=1 Tax=Dokdonella sp. TaxID=2291710 RepID=UPI003267CB61